ncbi:MAG: hypothetical protein Q8889_01095 [Candidatus Phytoplasma australasiaticum]|nr:hypothetical protein [Candidatus Phytoplasma australasiaticum]MDV3199709.1 hypothetical protein [Candidatus Phytoplasma australasiaticum]
MKNKIKQLRFIPGVFILLYYIIINNNILLAHLINNSTMLSDSVALTNQDINNISNEQKSELLKIFNNKLNVSESILDTITELEKEICFKSLDHLVRINQGTFYSDPDDITRLNNIATIAKDIIESSSHDQSLSTIKVNNLKDSETLNQLLSNCSKDIIKAFAKLIFNYSFDMLFELSAQTPGIVAFTIVNSSLI